MLRGSGKLLSIIIPVYKQERTIQKNLEIVISDLEKTKIPFEIIAVIDGRIDKSYAHAKKVKSKYLKVVSYKNNRGKGYAVRYGMAKSRGGIVGFLDAGGDISAKGIPMMLEHMDWYKADIIVGSKRHPVSQVNYPPLRRFMSIGYQILVRLLFGLRIRDTQVGLKIYKRKVLVDVLPRLLVKQFAFDIEILAVAHHLGYRRIYEAPIVLKFPGTSTITSSNFWKIVTNMVLDTLAVFYRLKILRYYNDYNKRQWVYDKELKIRINVG